MTDSVQMRMAHASKQARLGRRPGLMLAERLTMAQAGAAIRLAEVCSVSLDGAAQESIDEITSRGFLRHIEKLGPDYPFDGEFIQLVAGWLDAPDQEVNEAKLGHWAMSMYLGDFTPDVAHSLTTLLVGQGWGEGPPGIKSVRRYPTGGISEKQALILPAFIRLFSERLGVCSPFLVARRLAHTGGTRDKLSAIPGFRFFSGDRLRDWDGARPAVCYFSADKDFCPRDSVLYRIRGEVGAVDSIPLMVSSILSKQVSYKVDCLMLDVLYGENAFLKSSAEVHEFVDAFASVAERFFVDVRPMVRLEAGAQASAVGNIVEICEVLDSIRRVESGGALEVEYELMRSIDFVRVLFDFCGESTNQVQELCALAIKRGEVFDSLLALWRDHGVSNQDINAIRVNHRGFLLGRLHVFDVKSDRSGRISGWDMRILADVSNNMINAYRDNLLDEREAMVGGVEILEKVGAFVDCGQVLARVYSESEDLLLPENLRGACIIS